MVGYLIVPSIIYYCNSYAQSIIGEFSCNGYGAVESTVIYIIINVTMVFFIIYGIFMCKNTLTKYLDDYIIRSQVWGSDDDSIMSTG